MAKSKDSLKDGDQDPRFRAVLVEPNTKAELQELPPSHDTVLLLGQLTNRSGRLAILHDSPAP
ncbi:MAG TPA: hypothetical protein VNS60_09265 [Solirubrobacterales bacterium]|nr:hypothetical protein [Solirubrobacterales bacterium]